MDYFEFTFSINPVIPGRDILIANLSELSFDSFVESENGVQAFVKENLLQENEISKTIDFIKNSGFEISFEKQLLKDQNWNAIWESSFDPVIISNQCIIRAAFHVPAINFKYDIIIEPKMSFGTGHHETTTLMIEQLLKMELQDMDVLDMGCGTSVLAILAAKRNAKTIMAIDNDEWAYNNSLENIKKNNCNNIVVSLGDAASLEGKIFDVIIANINRNILLRDLKFYNSSLRNDGKILLSGFFEDDISYLQEECNKQNLAIINVVAKNNWALLEIEKKN